MDQKFCGGCGEAMPDVVVVDAPISVRATVLDVACEATSSGEQPAWKVYEKSLADAKAAGDRPAAKALRAAEGQRLMALSFKETMREARDKGKEAMRKAGEKPGT
jgi:hypothetical protein